MMSKKAALAQAQNLNAQIATLTAVYELIKLGHDTGTQLYGINEVITELRKLAEKTA